tara:strand:- start:254 stop:487 length:234 start_codon:yes stop_codon:yes gene_type:complete
MSSDEKKISKSTYVWSHIAIILFHTILGLLLISTYFYPKIANVDSKIIVLIVGILLTILSLGSLAPILMDNKKIIIE